ncbi:unnamed protein product [marine sediment metagenome]|uniref:Uncharacterized protein n=1 Tax=marine sediment metagenome TaxID=412755 RepID=X1E1G2_9ZZZZ
MNDKEEMDLLIIDCERVVVRGPRPFYVKADDESVFIRFKDKLAKCEIKDLELICHEARFVLK